MDIEPQDKPIWGAKAIGEKIGLSERQAFYMLEKKLLPGEKVGRQWVSTLRRLRTRVERGE